MRGSMRPSRGPGSRRTLTFESQNADKGAVGSKGATGSSEVARARSDTASTRERGQALVEFALIAPLFLVIVVGLIQFGIGLNYWLDLNKIANQGARWAVVNKYPDCPDDPGCTLEEHLETQALSEGLRKDIRVEICFVDSSTGAVGEPLRVRAYHDLRFAAILDMWSITLKGEATMRIEQDPAKLRETDQGVVANSPCA
jgi:hypothetical protein